MAEVPGRCWCLGSRGGVGWGSNSEALRAKTTVAFKNDVTAHEDMELKASGDTWDKVKRRSVFRTVPVKQLKRVLDDWWPSSRC